MNRRGILLGALLAILARAGELPGASIRFEDVTGTSGVRFRHSFGDAHLSNIVEDTGSGACILDYDSDGLPDLFLVSGRFLPGISDPAAEPPRLLPSRPPGNEAGMAPPDAPQRRTGDGGGSRLHRNLGGGRFVDVTEVSGLADTGYGIGAAAGDVDGDGFLDIYLTCYGPNQLFRNRGDGTFEDVTAAAGAALAGTFSVGATFLDFDGDSDLDLFVSNYLEYDPAYAIYYAADAYPGPLSYDGQADSLLENRGGTFHDVSGTSGMAAVLPGRGMGCGAADVDGDGRLDVYVANDLMANYLYRGPAGGPVADVASLAGCAYNLGGEGTNSMAVAFADLDNDGDFDLYLTDGSYGSLYRNDTQGPGRIRFVDVTAASGTAGPSGPYIGWGGGVADFDNDGLLDLFRINGDFNHIQPQEDLVFRGLGDLRFEDVSARAGAYFLTKHQGRGVAFGDLDLDGRVDAVLVNLKTPAVILRNVSPPEGHWIRLELVGAGLRDPVGARVRAWAGSRAWLAQVEGGNGYASQSERIVHLGLGPVRELTRLEVRWPGGKTQVLEGLAPDRVVRLVEASGEEVP